MELLKATAKTQDASKRAGVISSFATGLKVALLLGTVLVASEAGTYLYFRNRVSTDDAQVEGLTAALKETRLRAIGTWENPTHHNRLPRLK